MPGVYIPHYTVPTADPLPLWMDLVLFGFLLGSIICIVLYIIREGKYKEPPWEWWNHNDEADERVWPPKGGHGRPLPRIVEKQKTPVGMWGRR